MAELIKRLIEFFYNKVQGGHDAAVAKVCLILIMHFVILKRKMQIIFTYRNCNTVNFWNEFGI